MKGKVAYFGVFMALALIFSYVEALVPIPMGIPGIKLGLANLIIVVALYKVRIGETYILSVGRILLSGLLFGSMFSILYSMAGGVLSLTTMYFLKKTGKFSVMGVSLAGGVFHNLGQLIMAAIVLESSSIFYYFPILLIAGMLTGLLIGVIANESIKRLRIR